MTATFECVATGKMFWLLGHLMAPHVLLTILLLVALPDVLADEALKVTILNHEGTAVTTISSTSDDPFRLRFSLPGEENHEAVGTVNFTSYDLNPDCVVKFSPQLCQRRILVQRIEFLCPLAVPSTLGQSEVQYHLAGITFHRPGALPTSVGNLPDFEFTVVAPSKGGSSQFTSDPVVLQVAINPTQGEADITSFHEAQFLDTLKSFASLPKRTDVNVLTVMDMGSGRLQVVIELHGTEEVRAAVEALMLMFDTNNSVQKALSIVPPALYGTKCPTFANQTCNAVGSCQYLDGHCECPEPYEGNACERHGATTTDFPKVTIAIAIVILCTWLLGWLINRMLWAQEADKKHRQHELFTQLSPLHRTTPGTLLYRTLATVYLALCVAGCAFPRTSSWYSQASIFALPQIFRLIRLDLPDVPLLPVLAYVLVGLFVPYCIYLNNRLMFLVHMDYTAWHRCFDYAATRKLAAHPMIWTKPRLRPPGYTPHYALLVVDLFYPTLTPLICGILMSSFVCDQVDGVWKSRLDHQVNCFQGIQVPIAIVSGIFLLVFYVCFLISSYVFVAATERLQNRNLELGLPSLIRDRRSSFVVKTQFMILIIGVDVFLSNIGPWPFLAAGLVICGFAAACLLAYHIQFSPCNIPLCNWISIGAFLFGFWPYILVIPSFFFHANGLMVDVEVLLGMLVSHVVVGAAVVYLLHRTSKGPKGGAPTWFAIRMAEATRREQTELCRINSSKHLSKEDLDFDVDELPTPHSMPPTTPRRTLSITQQGLQQQRQSLGIPESLTPTMERSVLLEDNAMQNVLGLPEAQDDDMSVAIDMAIAEVVIEDVSGSEPIRRMSSEFATPLNPHQSATVKLLNWPTSSNGVSSSAQSLANSNP